MQVSGVGGLAALAIKGLDEHTFKETVRENEKSYFRKVLQNLSSPTQNIPLAKILPLLSL